MGPVASVETSMTRRQLTWCLPTNASCPVQDWRPTATWWLTASVLASLLRTRLCSRRNPPVCQEGVLPTKVSDMFTNRQLSVKKGEAPFRHIDMEHGQKICISVKQVPMCPTVSQPAEIVPMEMPFFCVARTQEGRALQELTQSGEKITEALRFPIAFSSTVQVPRRC